jgi:hypothetical protein
MSQTIFEGTSGIQRMIIGRAVTGLAAATAGISCASLHSPTRPGDARLATDMPVVGIEILCY